MIEIREATKSQAEEIARLKMTAMTADCCLYFCGEGHGQEDMTAGRADSCSAEQASLHRSRLLAAFLKMMTMLVEREDSQYCSTIADGNQAAGQPLGVAMCGAFGR